MPLSIQDIIVVLCLIVIAKDILLIFLFHSNFKSVSVQHTDQDSLPFVSILLSVRNEEMTIQSCIEHLESQDYPADRFEILVGNDRSEDSTLNMLRSLELKVTNLRVFDIEQLIQKKHGKMNVLAHLGEFAKGEYFLFTDADTVVPPSWIRMMVLVIQNEFGVITGTTLVNGASLFARLQRIEWGHAIAMMKSVSDMNIQVSSIGNNMAVSRKAYSDVGGFEGIPFSVTEDYEIYRQICNRGFRSFHIYEKEVLATSNESPTLFSLLMQRKRWMFGAFRLPFAMLLILILNSMYYPAIIAMLFLDPLAGSILVFSKFMIQGIFIKTAFRKLDEKTGILEFIIYEFYAAMINLLAVMAFIIPIKIRWKGRSY